MPGSFGSFVTVERLFSCRDFAPSCQAFRIDPHQDDSARRSSAETRLEEMDEWHLNFPKFHSINLHKGPISNGLISRRIRILRSPAYEQKTLAVAGEPPTGAGALRGGLTASF